MARLLTHKGLEMININRAKVAADMLNAYVLYGDKVGARVAQLKAEHEARPDDHRIFCIIKGILSPQYELSANIEMARFLSVALHKGLSAGELYSIASVGGLRMGVATGQHINYIVEQANIILSMTDNDMTYDNLRKLKGVGPKVAAWIMSLYFGETDVYTIDRHMMRGFTGDAKLPTNAQYGKLMTEILEIHREVLPGIAPLVGQWSLWNVYRGVGHDDHVGIVVGDRV